MSKDAFTPSFSAETKLSIVLPNEQGTIEGVVCTNFINSDGDEVVSPRDRSRYLTRKPGSSWKIRTVAAILGDAEVTVMT